MIGLIGGLSWENSAEYYRLINQGVRARRGGVASAHILLWSFDFAVIEPMQTAGDWPAATAAMLDAAQHLERCGAGLILICSNTLHRAAADVQSAIGVPLLHIADPTADAIKAVGLTRIGLLGTAFTMEHAFYRRRLADRGLTVLVPNADDRMVVHRVIYDELVQGLIRPEPRAACRAIITRLVNEGAQAIILGCTEIMLLVDASDSAVPLFDTTALHASAAVDWLLRA